MKSTTIQCRTADTACRLLFEVANGHVERRYVRRTLRAVAQWIVDNEAEHQATLEGAAALVLEAGRRMRAAESKTEP